MSEAEAPALLRNQTGAAAPRYNDLGKILENINGGSFPSSEQEMVSSLTVAYEHQAEYNLPDLWRPVPPRPGASGGTRKRYYCSLRVYGRSFKVHARTCTFLLFSC